MELIKMATLGQSLILILIDLISLTLTSDSSDYQAKLFDLRDLRSVEEFLSSLGHSTDTVELSTNTEQEICKPQNTLLCLDETNPLDEELKAGSFWFPRCVHVPRCGQGCCFRKELDECVPIERSWRTITRYISRPGRRGRRSNRELVMRNITLEVHDDCSCECRNRPKCTSSDQQFSEESCACVCTNHDSKSACFDKRATHRWDPDTCSCRCRSEFDCERESNGVTRSGNEVTIRLDDQRARQKWDPRKWWLQTSSAIISN